MLSGPSLVCTTRNKPKSDTRRSERPEVVCVLREGVSTSGRCRRDRVGLQIQSSTPLREYGTDEPMSQYLLRVDSRGRRGGTSPPSDDRTPIVSVSQVGSRGDVHGHFTCSERLRLGTSGCGSSRGTSHRGPVSEVLSLCPLDVDLRHGRCRPPQSVLGRVRPDLGPVVVGTKF